MMRRKKSPPKIRTERMLETVFRILVSSGSTPSELRERATRILNKMPLQYDRGSEAYREMLGMASILHRWNNQRLYVDSHANPLSIKLRGKAPSLESLHRSERMNMSVGTMVREMLKLKVIRRHNSRYRPMRNQLIGGLINPIRAQYIATAIGRLLSTIENNTELSRRPTLIERFAFVPNMAAGEYNDFCEFSHSQGSALVSEINDWLETRRIRGGSRRGGKTIPVGVHIFAFRQPDGRRTHLS